MAKCANCGSMVVFGGKKVGGMTFCRESCLAESSIVGMMEQVPEDLLRNHVDHVHKGNCPICAGAGPVDVHTSHQIWSALLMTSWKSVPKISCRSCGVKSKIGNMLFSFVFGWWGFPWGLLLTPVQVLRNLVGLFMAPDPTKPSEGLESMLRLELAGQIMEAQEQGAAMPEK